MRSGRRAGKLLAGLLAAVMIFMLMPSAIDMEGNVVHAASENFTPRFTEPDYNYTVDIEHYQNGNPYSGPVNCTYYAYGRAYELLGYRLPTWGHARDWWDNADGYEKSGDARAPRLGAIVCWNGTSKNPYGHVAVVEEINGDMIRYSEANYQGSSFHVSNLISVNNLSNSDNTFEGYIYLPLSGNKVKGYYHELGAGRTIQDGDYHIATDLDPEYKYGLDILGASAENGTNAQIAPTVGNDNQVFHVEYVDKGFYRITHKKTGKCLEVADASEYSGANVRLWESNNSAAQRCSIAENGDGTFRLWAQCSGFSLDVQGGGTPHDRQNVQVYQENDTPSQKWHFVPYGKSTGRTIADGEYQIVCMNDPSKTMGPAGNEIISGTDVRLGSHIGDRRYTFDVKYVGDGYYNIIHHASNLSLDITNGGIKNGTNLQLYQQGKNGNWKWIIKPDGGGYNIVSLHNALYVDLSNGASADGTNIQMWIGNGSAAQKWMFIPWVSTPVITDSPSASEITYGQTLSNSILNGGSVNTGGRFVWKNGNIRPSCADSGKTLYQAVFLPANEERWERVETAVTVKVNPAKNPPAMPENTMYPDHSKKTVGEVALPAGWRWKQSDQSVQLQDQKTIRATAVYTGGDRGNYVNESVLISLIRSACSHPGDMQEVRGALAASTGKDGYTGDVFCRECQTVLKRGTVIEALKEDAGPGTGQKPALPVPGQSFSENQGTPVSGGNSGTTESGGSQGITGTGNPANTVGSGPTDTYGIETPAVTVIKYNTIQLRWAPVSNAKTYEVYYSTSEDFSNARKLAKTKKTTCRFSKANCGQTYYFQIRAYEKSGKKLVCTAVSPIVEGKTYLTGNLSVSAKTMYNCVTLKWKKINGAKRYEVYRAAENGEYIHLTTIKGAQYKDKTVHAGEHYRYYIKAVSDGNMDEKESNVLSVYPTLKSGPKLKIKSADGGSRNLSWSKVPGAEYYEIYRLNGTTGEYEKIGTVYAPVLFFADTGVKEEFPCIYKVRACAGSSETESKPVTL